MKFAEPTVVSVRREEDVLLRVRGVLNYAKSTPRTRQVEIKDDAGESHRIDVPEGMMADVVRPHFEARVVAEVMRATDGRLELLDVWADEEAKSV